MTSGTSDTQDRDLQEIKQKYSFDPAAEKTCEDLLNMALQVDSGNSEALQALASVRLSQQRPDEAKQFLEQAWTQWKDFEPGQHSSFSP